MLAEPLKAFEAKQLILAIIDDGTVVISKHMEEKLAERGMSTVDVLNVLRAGNVNEAEWENGRWNHQVHTGRMVVVVGFRSETKLVCVTAWRKT